MAIPSLGEASTHRKLLPPTQQAARPVAPRSRSRLDRPHRLTRHLDWGEGKGRRGAKLPGPQDGGERCPWMGREYSPRLSVRSLDEACNLRLATSGVQLWDRQRAPAWACRRMRSESRVSLSVS
jgi:hypothetical protein